jgi:tetratricopeptide (TPR) repeat protein
VLRHCAAAILIGCLAGACASDPFKDLPRQELELAVAIELDETPFFPQRDYQCGPAALATILAGSGVGVRPDELISRVYIPARRGSLQPELLATSREYQRIPYVIPPDFAALVAEVALGRPVLVLQNLGTKVFPQWHYAVVVGFSRERREVILRSGTDRRRVTGAGIFVRTWRRGGMWGVVALKPGELPATGDSDAYLRAVAAAESAGKQQLSEPSYVAAAERWPDSSLAWLGLGNSAYTRGDSERAEHMYRRALRVDPANAPALNNLATVVAEQGRCDEASQLLESAMELPDLHTSMFKALATSKAEIDGCK